MTRGKYAAKANGLRAEAAQNTVHSLRTQLEQARRDHAAEAADLKAQINTLQGRLVRDTQTLAADEVDRVRRAAREHLEAERAERHDTAVKIADLLSAEGCTASLTQDRLGELVDLLGLDRGEMFGRDGNRQARRVTKKRMRYADSLVAAGHTTDSIQGGAGTGFSGVAGVSNRKIFTVGGEGA